VPVKLLFVTHVPADPFGSVWHELSRRAAFARAQGHEAQVLGPADLGLARAGRLLPILLPIAAAHRLAREHADVAVFHSYAGAWFLASGAARRRSIGTAVMFHGLEPLYFHALAREMERASRRLSWRFRMLHTVWLPALLRASCARADRIYCLNQREAAHLAAERWCDPQRVAVVSHAVDPMWFVARDYAPRARRLLFVGQWLPAKGTRYLVEAFARLAAERPDLELVCAGVRAPAAVVRGDFPAAVADRVVVVPEIAAEALVAEHAAADLFVFPSLSEGFSGALLEAMASGLPIVATPAGAAADILEDGGNARLAPFADGAALARRIAELLDDPTRRAAIGRAAQETARRFTPDRVYPRFIADLRGLATARAAAGRAAHA
jgi:glycosyltransferase involved in cell wall biosynthesis